MLTYENTFDGAQGRGAGQGPRHPQGIPEHVRHGFGRVGQQLFQRAVATGQHPDLARVTHLARGAD